RERKLIEGVIPTASPKFGQRRRTPRRVHNRLGFHTDRAPNDRGEMKQTEMQNEDETDHSDPSGQQGIMEAPRQNEEKRGAEKDLRKNESGFGKRWNFALSPRREKASRIHSWPGEEVCDHAARTGEPPISRGPISELFAA